MVEIIGALILFADDLFTVDDKKPFGYKFWLSILVYIVSVFFDCVAIFIFVMLLNMLNTDIWWVIGLTETLIGVFIFLTSKRLFFWTNQLIRHINYR